MSADSASKAGAETKKDETVKPKTIESPPETVEERRTRRVILITFWSVVIFLGLPLWIWTTTVYRADLPLDVMTRWSEGEVCQLTYPLHIVIKASGQSQNELEVLEENLAVQLNLHGPPSLYRYRVSSGHPASDSADLNINFNIASHHASPAATLHSFGRQLDVQCDQISAACIEFTTEQVKAIFVDEQAAVRHLLENTAYSSQIPPNEASIGNTQELEQRSIRAFKYASSYHLTFSLFSASAIPSAWGIDTALQQYLQPLLQSLSSVSNFTVDTQVQLYSAISPSISGPHFDAASGSWQLHQSDLSGFINAAEWPLSPSINGGTTINFVLYIPSADRSPLVVANTSKNSWIIPQWGGVQILNRPSAAGDNLGLAELEHIMYTFADQLTALVGLPPRPVSLQLRIDGLARERLTSLMLSASSTLGALHKLTKKLQSIAIPTSVAQSVDSTISHLSQACAHLSEGRFQTALEHARDAEVAAEHAFFEPSMVGQVYFPDEHKVAVYVPLLGPMAVPLLMATLKEFKQWRQGKVKTN